MDFKISLIVVFVTTLIFYVTTLHLACASLGFVLFFFVTTFLPCLQFLPFVKFVATKFMNVMT